MKKRIISTVICALFLCAMLSFAAFAEDGINAYVSIADENGKSVLALASVAVSDADGDGKISVGDALFCAHEAYYEGGAEAGYASEETEYGFSLTKLWGCENGGSYGYYVNDAAAMSLVDEIADGAHISAFVYTDTAAFSDTYSYFDIKTVEAVAGESVEFTLLSAGYDENWNPISLAVECAVITVGGESTEYVTDANGKVSISFYEAGTYTVSATSENATLVPPVCVVSVPAVTEDTSATETESESEESSESESSSVSESESESSAESSSAEASSSVPTAPQTGDVALYVVLAGCFSAVIALCICKKSNEKR